MNPLELDRNQLFILDKSLGLYQTGVEAVIAGIIAYKLIDTADPSYTAYWESQKQLLSEVINLRLVFVNQRESMK